MKHPLNECMTIRRHTSKYMKNEYFPEYVLYPYFRVLVFVNYSMIDAVNMEDNVDEHMKFHRNGYRRQEF